MSPCYGFHASVIPADADEVVDTQGRTYRRAGPRSWTAVVPSDQPARIYEPWLLENIGPVRCPIVEDVLAARDAKLLERLTASALGPGLTWLPGHPDSDPVVFEDAMMLMRGGWLAWGPKQRGEALAVVRQSEMDEVAKTS